MFMGNVVLPVPPFCALRVSIYRADDAIPGMDCRDPTGLDPSSQGRNCDALDNSAEGHGPRAQEAGLRGPDDTRPRANRELALPSDC